MKKKIGAPPGGWLQYRPEIPPFCDVDSFLFWPADVWSRAHFSDELGLNDLFDAIKLRVTLLHDQSAASCTTHGDSNPPPPTHVDSTQML